MDDDACLQTLQGHTDSVTSIAFLYDSTRLASASYDKTVKIWDASSGVCLQTFNTAKVLWKISFNLIGSCLHTETGTITISTSSTTDVTEPLHPQYEGVGVSSDGAWITYNGKKTLWLPSDYRPSCSAMSGVNVGIGVGSGEVWICCFHMDKSELQAA
jgi:WD40 repeat protein